MRKWPNQLPDKLFFRIDGVMYSWTGWFGCQLESHEWRRYPAGTERVILGMRFRVWTTERHWFTCCTIERHWFKCCTTWALCELPDDVYRANETLRELRAKLVKDLFYY